MAIKHGGVGPQPFTVRGSCHFQPPFPGQLALTGQLAYAGAEDLGPTSGQGSETGLNQVIKCLINRFSGQLGQVIDFHTGKGLDMDIGPDFLDTSEQI